MKNAIGIIILLSFTSLFSAEVLKVKEEGAFIFSKEDGGKKIAVMGLGEEVYLLQRGHDRSKVKADGGFVGWVPNAKIEYKILEEVSTFKLDNIDINSWLDNPKALYILDENLESGGLLLTRDFSYEIFEFMDRETIERANDEN